MIGLVTLLVVVALMAFAVLGFFVNEWTSPWRTRRSGSANNWQNEGFMANQDGKSWSDIDGTASSTPKRPTGAGTWN